MGEGHVAERSGGMPRPLVERTVHDPARRRLHVLRETRTGNDVRLVVVLYAQQLREPVGFGSLVIVDECDEITVGKRHRERGIARKWDATAFLDHVTQRIGVSRDHFVADRLADPLESLSTTTT